MALSGIMSQITGSNTILLFVGLVVVFVIGYKVLQAVIDVFMIAGMSGVFYVAMSYVGIAPSLSLSRVLLFMILGTGLYILYSSLRVVASVATSVGSGIWSIVSGVMGGVASVWNWIVGLFESDEGSEEGSKKQKKIILDESGSDED